MVRDKLHPLDRWHHIAMVYDGEEYRSYVNGELQTSAKLRLAPQGAGRASVGVRITLVDYFKGAIQKARFTHRALSPDGVHALKSGPRRSAAHQLVADEGEPLRVGRPRVDVDRSLPSKQPDDRLRLSGAPRAARRWARASAAARRCGWRDALGSPARRQTMAIHLPSGEG